MLAWRIPGMPVHVSIPLLQKHLLMNALVTCTHTHLLRAHMHTFAAVPCHVGGDCSQGRKRQESLVAKMLRVELQEQQIHKLLVCAKPAHPAAPAFA